jgi:hypothetical protein
MFQPTCSPSDLTHEIDPRLCDLIEWAQRHHHKIAQCPACEGPLVHSKQVQLARCFRCGHAVGEQTQRCWTCRTPTVSRLPPDVKCEAAMGRVPVQRLVRFHTCQTCGGQAEAPMVAHRSWRKCENCRKPLSGPPLRGRGRDLCAVCRGRRLRQQQRESRDRRRSAKRKLAADSINVSGPI